MFPGRQMTHQKNSAWKKNTELLSSGTQRSCQQKLRRASGPTLPGLVTRPFSVFLDTPSKSDLPPQQSRTRFSFCFVVSAFGVCVVTLAAPPTSRGVAEGLGAWSAAAAEELEEVGGSSTGLRGRERLARVLVSSAGGGEGVLLLWAWLSDGEPDTGMVEGSAIPQGLEEEIEDIAHEDVGKTL